MEEDAPTLMRRLFAADAIKPQTVTETCVASLLTSVTCIDLSATAAVDSAAAGIIVTLQSPHAIHTGLAKAFVMSKAPAPGRTATIRLLSLPEDDDEHNEESLQNQVLCEADEALIYVWNGQAWTLRARTSYSVPVPPPLATDDAETLAKQAIADQRMMMIRKQSARFFR